MINRLQCANYYPVTQKENLFLNLNQDTRKRIIDLNKKEAYII